MKKLSVLALSMLLVLGLATTAFAASFNNPTFSKNIQANGGMPNFAVDDSTYDNNINNANSTGYLVGDQNNHFTDVIKSKGMTNALTRNDGTYNPAVAQRTHGEYQNNTNSCASCHQTHTASGQDLLFKNSVYATCTACHDGTLGFYNVFNASTAGTFGGDQAGNASMHLATGAVKIGAAPGGAGESATKAGWQNDFSCNSCHTPHGSYSSRLLHFNPNNMADTTVANGGQKLVQAFGKSVADLGAATKDVVGVSYVVYDTYSTISGLGFTGPYATNNALYNGTVSTAVTAGTMTVAVVTGVDNGDGTYSYKFDTTPWLYEYEYNENHDKVLYTAFWTIASDDPNPETDFYVNPLDPKAGKNQVAQGSSTYTVDYANGFAFGKFPGAVTAAIGRDIITKLPVNYTYTDSVNSFTYGKTDADFYAKTSYGPTGKAPQIAAGTGISVSKFCAACHTDYLASETKREAPGSTGTGMFSTAFRHTTDNDTYMCLRCHFAHGTDVTVMKDAKDRDYIAAATQLFAGNTDQAKAYMLDQNPSSALKRYTNMAVCWKCHTSSHSAGFQNTDYYKSLGYTTGTTTTKTTSVLPSGF